MGTLVYLAFCFVYKELHVSCSKRFLALLFSGWVYALTDYYRAKASANLLALVVGTDVGCVNAVRKRYFFFAISTRLVTRLVTRLTAFTAGHSANTRGFVF